MLVLGCGVSGLTLTGCGGLKTNGGLTAVLTGSVLETLYLKEPCAS